MITVTESALKRMKDQLANSDSVGIRLATKRAGCSGLKYDISFCDEVKESDILVKFDSVNVYVAGNSIDHLKGMEVDCVKNGLNEGFVFKNPNATNECGCGESFQTS